MEVGSWDELQALRNPRVLWVLAVGAIGGISGTCTWTRGAATVGPPTPAPTSTPLPVTSPAHEAVRTYLAAWAQMDYPAMYDLCSAASRTIQYTISSMRCS